jgi:hypothetical protein
LERFAGSAQAALLATSRVVDARIVATTWGRLGGDWWQLDGSCIGAGRAAMWRWLGGGLVACRLALRWQLNGG